MANKAGMYFIFIKTCDSLISVRDFDHFFFHIIYHEYSVSCKGSLEI